MGDITVVIVAASYFQVELFVEVKENAGGFPHEIAL
jgi:hypothetical protein